MTKTFERSFLCIEDTGGDFWAFHNQAMHPISNGDGGIHCRDIDHGIDLLKSRGHINETPLEKALEAVDELGWAEHQITKEDAVKIIRTLYEDMEAKND